MATGAQPTSAQRLGTGWERRQWRPAESWPAYAIGACAGAIIGAGRDGLEGLLFGALLGGTIAANVAQLAGILFRYLLFRLAGDPEVPSETLNGFAAILIGKMLGLASGLLVAWPIAAARAPWIALVCGLSASTRWGMLGSDTMRGAFRPSLTPASRRLVYGYYALDAAGTLLGLGVAAWVAPHLHNLVLMYLVLPVGGLAGNLAGVGAGMLSGTMPPWLARRGRRWHAPLWASRRYPPAVQLAEMMQSLRETLLRHVGTVPVTATGDAAEGERTEEVHDEHGDDEWAAETGGEPASAERTHGPEQALLPGLEPAAASRRPGQEPAPTSGMTWKAAEWNTGMAIGLGMALFAGTTGMVAGSLVLGQILPLLRRMGEPGRLRTTIAAIWAYAGGNGLADGEARTLAATTIGEVAGVLLGAAVGLWIGLGIPRAQLPILALVGACCTYNWVGGIGSYLARATSDGQILRERAWRVWAYYALRVVAVVVGLGAGLRAAAPFGEALSALFGALMFAGMSKSVATHLCAVAGVLPPWEPTLLRSARFRAWAARAYRQPRPIPASAVRGQAARR